MEFLGFWARMSEEVVPACARLWQLVAGCGLLALILIILDALRIEARKLQSCRPGLMSWLVDPTGLD